MPRISDDQISVQVVRNLEQLNHALLVRAINYVEGQECPIDEEYDGNDFSCTHLIVYVGKEPVGTIRVRYFGRFAKAERFSIRHNYRRSRALARMIEFGEDFAARKGFEYSITQAEARLVPLWKRYGYEVNTKKAPIVFSGHEYVELIKPLPRLNDALTLDTDGHILNRPEGSWDRPSILEKSSERGVDASFDLNISRRQS